MRYHLSALLGMTEMHASEQTLQHPMDVPVINALAPAPSHARTVALVRLAMDRERWIPVDNSRFQDTVMCELSQTFPQNNCELCIT